MKEGAACASCEKRERVKQRTEKKRGEKRERREEKQAGDEPGTTYLAVGEDAERLRAPAVAQEIPAELRLVRHGVDLGVEKGGACERREPFFKKMPSLGPVLVLLLGRTWGGPSAEQAVRGL